MIQPGMSAILRKIKPGVSRLGMLTLLLAAVVLSLMVATPRTAHAAEITISDQASCEAVSGYWNSGANMCMFFSDYPVAAGDTLTLSVSTYIHSLTNNGTVNTSNFLQAGYLTNNKGATINVSSGTLQPYNLDVSTNSGTINLNGGFLNLQGALTNNSDGLINVKGTVLTSDGSLSNQGTVRVFCSGSILGHNFSGNPPQHDDCTPPTANPNPLPAANIYGWNFTDVVVYWNWTDTGGSGIDDTRCNVISKSSGEGVNIKVTGSCTDKAGNTGTASYTVNVDETAPTISASATTADGKPYNPGTWTNQDVTVHFSCNDDRSGILLCTDDQTISADTGASGSMVEGYARDKAYNLTRYDFGPVMVDKSAPTINITATTADGQPYTSGAWTNQDVTLVVACSDEASGVAACPDAGSYTISSEGTTSKTFSSTDNAGNSASSAFTVKIDKTPPLIIGPDPLRFPDANGYYNHPVQFNNGYGDNPLGSGIASCTLGESYSGPDSNNASVTSSCTDNAGNTSSNTFTFKYDATPPTITASAKTADGKPYSAGTWTNQSVTVHFTCNDNLSGVASCPNDQTFGEGANQLASGQVTDNAGNSASTGFGPIKVDLTKPTVTYTGNAGIYTIDQTINITCTPADNLSGVASSTCANINGPAYSFALGNHSYSATATDNAGNTGSGSTSFTVGVTFDSLCSLSANFSTNPAVDKGLCDKLSAAKAAAAAGTTIAKNNELNAYRQQVAAQTGKALTKQQATILSNLSKML
ncbi:MAG TPA: hypothetical protein VH186_35300 [Chloroflexia bacterium]|nr:hypothetical protein [Chloroflexia bacterium]